MKIIETTFERLPRERLEIGFEGENLRATVRIDCASVFAEYPNATPSLIVKPLFADAYPVVVDRNGTNVDWLITSEILSFSGDGEIQLVFYKDEVICKSAVSKIRVCRSLQVTGEMPDPVVQWIENANRKLAEVDAALVSIDEMDAVAHGLPEGSAPTAEVQTVDDHKRISFGIPKGDKGERGEQGIQGEKGDKGDKGDPGDGTPAGGLTDQVLAKASDTDRDTKWMYVAPVIKNEASGSIASFPDGADGHLVDEVKVSIEPVQDLHGYDHPWPAGGGKNLWPYESLTTPDYNTRIYEGQYPEVFAMARRLTPGAKYRTGSDTSTGGRAFSALNIYYSDGTSAFIRSASMSGAIADLSDGSITIASINVQLGTADGTGERTSYKMVLEQTTTSNPAYTPYSNICPITGWTATKVNRTGKNLFDNVWENGIISNTTGENIPGNTHVRCKNYIPCKNGQTIYMGWDTTATGSVYMLVMVYGADGSFKRYAGARTSPFPLKLNDDEHFIRFYLYNRTEPLVNPYIVYGTTATDYEPYAGNTYDITLPTEAGTVYGGELTVNADGSGSLVVDRASVVFDGSNDESWIYIDNGRLYTPLDNSVDGNYVATRGTYITNYLTYASLPNDTDVIGCLLNNNLFQVRVSQSVVSVALLRGYLAEKPLQVCYKLKTPITFTLTASQIRTLLGQNNVWSDAGDVSVKYNADTKLYIDNKITQAIAAALNS